MPPGVRSGSHRHALAPWSRRCVPKLTQLWLEVRPPGLTTLRSCAPRARHETAGCFESSSTRRVCIRARRRCSGSLGGCRCPGVHLDRFSGCHGCSGRVSTGSWPGTATAGSAGSALAWCRGQESRNGSSTHTSRLVCRSVLEWASAGRSSGWTGRRTPCPPATTPPLP